MNYTLIIFTLLLIIYIWYRIFFPDGKMVVNTTNPNKDYYRYIIYAPTSKLKRKKYMVVQVVIDNQPIEENSHE